MPNAGNRMGYGAPGPPTKVKYVKPPKGTKTVSAIKPTKNGKKKR